MIDSEKSLNILLAERKENVHLFLERRALPISIVDTSIRSRLDDVETILLTSSPVHGLANDLSDIDAIVVVRKDVGISPMAAQLFIGLNHLEYIPFSCEDISGALKSLQAAATSDPSSACKLMAGWDSNHRVRKKYLERLINGVSTDYSCPYSTSISQLSKLWTLTSLRSCAEQMAFAHLAVCAGEARAVLAYLLNATLFLLDVIMSFHEDVYSNKKWYLLRWKRFIERAQFRDDARQIVDSAQNLVTVTSGALVAGLASPEMVVHLSTTLEHVRSVVAPSFDLRPVFQINRGTDIGNILDGVLLRKLEDGRFYMLPFGAELSSDAFPLDFDMKVHTMQARAVLALCRGGLAEFVTAAEALEHAK